MLLAQQITLNKCDLHIYDIAAILHEGYLIENGQVTLDAHEALKILDKKSDVKMQFSCDTQCSSGCKKVFFKSISDIHRENIDIDGKISCVNCNISKACHTEHYKQAYAKTCLERFKVDHPQKCKEICHKTMSTKTKKINNGTYSKTELKLKTLLGGCDKKISRYTLDVFIAHDNIDVEYDGWGHYITVNIYKKMTMSEFRKKEKIREKNILEKEGTKTIRFIAPHDKLPNDNVLLDLFNQAKKLLKNYNTVRIYLEEHNQMQCY